MEYWENRLTKPQAVAYQKAIKKFQRSKKNRDAQQDLYDELCNCGITPEEADEMVNLERQD